MMVYRLISHLLVIVLAASLLACDSAIEASSQESQGLKAANLVSVYPEPKQAGVSTDSMLRLVFDREPEDVSVSVEPLDHRLASIQIEESHIHGKEHFYQMTGLTPSVEYRLSVFDNAGSSLISDHVFRVGSAISNTDQIPTVVFASSDDVLFPLTSASSIHLLFSQWMDESRVAEAEVQLMYRGELIATSLRLIRDRLTITPLHDLSTSGTYELRVANFVDRSGQLMELFETEFEVELLGDLSRINLVSLAEGDRRSLVKLNSALIGTETIEIQSSLGAYLADPALFDGYNPLLIKMGSQFEGAAIDIKLNGVLSTGLNSSTLRFTLLNDAVGYIWKNRHTDSFESPQSISMLMDLSVSADNPKVNALITQDLLAVRVSGLANIKGDQFVFDLNADVHLDLLETAGIHADLNLMLQTQDLSTNDSSDYQAPVLLGSVPMQGAIDVGIDQKLRVFFDETIALTSSQAKLELVKANNPSVAIPMRALRDGSVLDLYPQENLEHATDYVLHIQAGFEDLVGNATTERNSVSFSTVQAYSSVLAAPHLSAVYPGVACALQGGSLSNGVAGRCSNVSGIGGSERYTVFSIPADHHLEVNFSNRVKASSLSLSSSCSDPAAIRVERVDWSSGTSQCVQTVPGSVEFDGLRWKFRPEEYLTEGASYQLVIHAGSDSTCGSNEVCGENNKTLDSSPLDISWSNGGGDDVVIPFVAEPASAGDTHQMLKTAVVADLNGNYLVDPTESTTPRSSMKLKMDICDQSNCSYGTSYCDYPGDPTPNDPNYSCNPDAPRTAIGSSITFASSNQLYTSAVLPIVLETLQYDAATASYFIPARIPAAVLPITGFDLRVIAVIGVDIDTGPMFLRVRQDGVEGQATEVRGRLVVDNDAEDTGLRFEVELNSYLDAPNIQLPGQHNLKNFELNCKLSGPVSFNEEGQMNVLLQNEATIKIPMAVTGTFLGIGNGDVVFEVAPGDFKLDLVGSK